MPIVEAIAAIASALATAKQLKDIDAEFNKSALKGKVSELTDALYEAKDALRDAGEQISALEEKLLTARKMVWREPFYWYMSEADGIEDGPFCQLCWDKDGNQIRIVGQMDHRLTCRNCKNSYDGPNYVAREKPDVAELARKLHRR